MKHAVELQGQINVYNHQLQDIAQIAERSKPVRDAKILDEKLLEVSRTLETSKVELNRLKDIQSKAKKVIMQTSKFNKQFTSQQDLVQNQVWEAKQTYQ